MNIVLTQYESFKNKKKELGVQASELTNVFGSSLLQQSVQPRQQEGGLCTGHRYGGCESIIICIFVTVKSHFPE